MSMQWNAAFKVNEQVEKNAAIYFLTLDASLLRQLQQVGSFRQEVNGVKAQWIQLVFTIIFFFLSNTKTCPAWEATVAKQSVYAYALLTFLMWIRSLGVSPRANIAPWNSSSTSRLWLFPWPAVCWGCNLAPQRLKIFCSAREMALVQLTGICWKVQQMAFGLFGEKELWCSR